MNLSLVSETERYRESEIEKDRERWIWNRMGNVGELEKEGRRKREMRGVRFAEKDTGLGPL